MNRRLALLPLAALLLSACSAPKPDDTRALTGNSPLIDPMPRAAQAIMKGLSSSAEPPEQRAFPGGPNTTLSITRQGGVALALRIDGAEPPEHDKRAATLATTIGWPTGEHAPPRYACVYSTSPERGPRATALLRCTTNAETTIRVQSVQLSVDPQGAPAMRRLDDQVFQVR